MFNNLLALSLFIFSLASYQSVARSSHFYQVVKGLSKSYVAQAVRFNETTDVPYFHVASLNIIVNDYFEENLNFKSNEFVIFSIYTNQTTGIIDYSQPTDATFTIKANIIMKMAITQKVTFSLQKAL